MYQESQRPRIPDISRESMIYIHVTTRNTVQCNKDVLIKALIQAYTPDIESSQ